MRIGELSPERWQRVDALFDRGLMLDPERRPAFLQEECGADTELRAAVEALLAMESAAADSIGEHADGFATNLFTGPSAPADEAEPEDLEPATLVGAYRVVRELGSGGMGRVYLAERADGRFERTVALKLVKRGMDTDEVLRRFRREHRILASLAHPGIATLLDAGATPDGRPFLVMEYLDGLPLHRWHSEKEPDLRTRLALMARICDAVEHAHRRLVVHRDLKPSNVLVGPAGEPKLLDFGIAKLLDGEDDGRTRTGVRVLTPEVAAPEQLRGDPVGTSTDVHGLGVLLYGLLTGRGPYEGARRSGGHQPPPKPPSALAPADERNRVRGDLDMITLRALHPDPERRYRSAAALAADLRRYLGGFPVEARPDSRRYRVRKWAGRHRAAVAAGVLALAVLTVAGALIARERAEAQRERDAALSASAFMESIFEAADPFAGTGERLDTLPVSAVLDRALERLDDDLDESPRVRARLLHTLGTIFLNGGATERGDSLLRQAVALRRVNGEPPASLGASLLFLGRAALDRGRPDEAEAPLREGLALGDALDPHDRAALLVNLGVVHQEKRDFAAADSLYQQALTAFRALPGTGHRQANVLNNLGYLDMSRGDFEAALPRVREALELHRSVLHPTHPALARTINNVAVALRRTGNVAGAEPLYREALEILDSTLDPPHPMLITGLTNLGSSLAALGRDDEAEARFRSAVAQARQAYPEAHPVRALTIGRLADHLAASAPPDSRPHPTLEEADALAAEALRAIRLARDGDHPDVVHLHRVAGDVAAARGRSADAARLYTAGLAIAQRILPPDHPLARSLGERLEPDGDG